MSETATRRGGLNQFLNSIADSGLDALRAIRGRRGTERDIAALCQELLTTTGEATGTAVAREVVAAYRTLDDAGRRLRPARQPTAARVTSDSVSGCSSRM